MEGVELFNVSPDRTDVQFATVGEAYGLGMAQRLGIVPGLTISGRDQGVPGGIDARFGPVASGPSDQGDLLYNGGGWLNPRRPENRNRFENLMPGSMLVSTGNFVPQIDLIWDDFPLGYDAANLLESAAARRLYWYESFHGTTPNGQNRLDATVYTYDGDLIVGRAGPGVGNGQFPRSPRTAVNASGLVSTTYRPHTLDPNADIGSFVGSGTLQVPTGMPTYTDDSGGDTRYGDLEVMPPVRASLNTGAFGELWRAFWNVMVDDVETAAVGSPRPDTVSEAFADPLADGRSAVGFTTAASREQVHRLRAAIAAVNVMDIRDVERAGNRDETDVTMASVPLNDPGATAPANLEARVFGTEAQPFIGEILVKMLADPTMGASYVGVELINPYPYALDTRGWKLVAVDDTGASLAFEVLVDLPATLPAAAGALGIAVLEGVEASSTVPAGINREATTVVSTGVDLTKALDGGTLREIMLMRPVLGSHTTEGADLISALNSELNANPDSVAWQLMVPLDTVNLAGRSPAGDQLVHYDRSFDDSLRSWNYVAHGPFSNGSAVVVVGANAIDVSLGTVTGTGARTFPSSLPIPVGPALSGPGASDTAGGRSFYPYGGFARDGDAMEIPYIGGYHIVDPAVTPGRQPVPGSSRATPSASMRSSSRRVDLATITASASSSGRRPQVGP